MVGIRPLYHAFCQSKLLLITYEAPSLTIFLIQGENFFSNSKLLIQTCCSCSSILSMTLVKASSTDIATLTNGVMRNEKWHHPFRDRHFSASRNSYFCLQGFFVFRFHLSRCLSGLGAELMVTPAWLPRRVIDKKSLESSALLKPY